MILRCDAIFCRAAASSFSLLHQQLLQRLARFLPDRIPILQKVALRRLRQRVRHRVRQLVQLVARDPHSTALYWFTSFILTS